MIPSKESILLLLQTLKHEYKDCGLEKLGLFGSFIKDERNRNFIDIAFEFSKELEEKIDNGDGEVVYFIDMLSDIKETLEKTFKTDVRLTDPSAVVDEEVLTELKGAIYV